MRTRQDARTTVRGAIALIMLLLVAGCDGDQADEGSATDPSAAPPGDEQPADDDTEVDGDSNGSDDPHGGDDAASDDGTPDGLEVLLAIDPSCVEVGESFTVLAEGLDPEARYAVFIDPEPSATGGFEPAIPANSDAAGELEVAASLPQDAGIQSGDYDVALATLTDGEIDEELIDSDLQIAETCG